jgi:hypothetical protein
MEEFGHGRRQTNGSGQGVGALTISSLGGS